MIAARGAEDAPREASPFYHLHPALENPLCAVPGRAGLNHQAQPRGGVQACPPSHFGSGRWDAEPNLECHLSQREIEG